MVLHIYNPRTMRVGAGELQVQDPSGLHRETLFQGLFLGLTILGF